MSHPSVKCLLEQEALDLLNEACVEVGQGVWLRQAIWAKLGFPEKDGVLPRGRPSNNNQELIIYLSEMFDKALDRIIELTNQNSKDGEKMNRSSMLAHLLHSMDLIEGHKELRLRKLDMDESRRFKFFFSPEDKLTYGGRGVSDKAAAAIYQLMRTWGRSFFSEALFAPAFKNA